MLRHHQLRLSFCKVVNKKKNMPSAFKVRQKLRSLKTRYTFIKKYFFVHLIVWWGFSYIFIKVLNFFKPMELLFWQKNSSQKQSTWAFLWTNCSANLAKFVKLAPMKCSLGKIADPERFYLNCVFKFKAICKRTTEAVTSGVL